jgi:hypothetical protein
MVSSGFAFFPRGIPFAIPLPNPAPSNERDSSTYARYQARVGETEGQPSSHALTLSEHLACEQKELLFPVFSFALDTILDNSEFDRLAPFSAAIPMLLCAQPDDHLEDRLFRVLEHLLQDAQND